MAIADVVGAMGALANFPEGYLTFTLESKSNCFAVGAGAALTARSAAAHWTHDDGVADDYPQC